MKEIATRTYARRRKDAPGVIALVTAVVCIMCGPYVALNGLLVVVVLVVVVSVMLVAVIIFFALVVVLNVVVLATVVVVASKKAFVRLLKYSNAHLALRACLLVSQATALYAQGCPEVCA